MESGSVGASHEGFLIPVSEELESFQSVLSPLQNAFLYEESQQFFRFKSAVLVKNPQLEEKYNAFREKKRKAGYSADDLNESYGFLLFDDSSQANALGETGVQTGNSTCTTLGDPSKGVYISMYSDCLDLNHWYHGKSGYIAIIRLTTGKVKKVAENYTQNYTEPSVGFDCHMSEQLSSVSAKTSSFVAFERTQYYVYELLDDQNSEAARCPSAACPFAIVSFSYMDTKKTLSAQEKESEEKKPVCRYLPWKGHLQIDKQVYMVELKLAAGAFIPAKLPPVVKVEKVLSMSKLRCVLPRTVFETAYTDEVFCDGVYCSVCEFVPSDLENNSSFTQLLLEIKQRNIALAVFLNDGGFLVLLHSSHFFMYDDASSTASEVLKGIFVFPDSRVVMGNIKFDRNKSRMPFEILQALPVLSYVEAKIEKRPLDSNEDLCEVLVEHMQRYATLINPGLGTSPLRDVSVFPDQYDIADAHNHLYSIPEWSNAEWQSLKSYFNKPGSFQLPLSKVSEILIAGQEERKEDLVDDVFIYLSSSEEEPENLDEQLDQQRSSSRVETSVDERILSDKHMGQFGVTQNVRQDRLPVENVLNEEGRLIDSTVLDKNDNAGTRSHVTPPTPGDLPTELIVSITSAERALADEINAVGTMSTPKDDNLQFPALPIGAKLPTADLNYLCGQTEKMQSVLDSYGASDLIITKKRGRRKGNIKPRKKPPEGPPCEPIVAAVVEVGDLNFVPDNPDLALDQSVPTDPPKRTWRKFQRRKRKFEKVSSKEKKSNSTISASDEETESHPVQQTLENTDFMEVNTFTLNKKIERWDLKPVISNSGRILVPFGSLSDNLEQVELLKRTLQSAVIQQDHEKTQGDGPVNDPVTGETGPVTGETGPVTGETGPVTGETNPVTGGPDPSRTTPDMLTEETEVTKPLDDGNCIQSVLPANSDEITKPSEHVEEKPSPCSESLSFDKVTTPATDDHMDTLPPLANLEKQVEILCPGKTVVKDKFLLSRLKKVLSRRKRRPENDTIEKSTNNAQDSDLSLKKPKLDLSEELKQNSEAIQTTKVNLDVSKMPSVDPEFALALGLTPNHSEVETHEDQNSPPKDGESKEQPQIIQKSPPIYPKGVRIKTLKKHQGISAENIKKKWWLHFQSPACIDSESVCDVDNSISKNAKEKMKAACSPTDALNLLADLALSASIEQVPPQPKPAQPQTSLEKGDLSKGGTNTEQESVLHALLRQPAVRDIHPLEASAPKPQIGYTDLVGLVSKEHAYSSPQSSFLLLGLLGTPFQVPPLTGSTGLLHHHQKLFGDGVKIRHASDIHEETSQQTRPSDIPYKEKSKKHSRTFVMKDGSLQVTRHWEDNYDFNLDSRLTSDPMGKIVIRALHGPWNFSINDTNEEIQLILHMWIGLFYSRSTARFFQFDLDNDPECSEGSNFMGNGLNYLPARLSRETKENQNNSFPLISKALDPSGKDIALVEPEPVILDLSFRNSKAQPATWKLQVFEESSSLSIEQHVETQKFKSDSSVMDSSEPLNHDACHQMAVNPEHHEDSVRMDDNVSCSPQGDMHRSPMKRVVTDRAPLDNGQTQEAFTFSKNHTKKLDETETCLVLKDGNKQLKAFTEKEKKDVIQSDMYDVPNSKTFGTHLCLELSSPGQEEPTNESATAQKLSIAEKEESTQEDSPPLSTDQTKNLIEDTSSTSRDCAKLNILREDGLFEKESAIPAIYVDMALEDQPSINMSESPVEADDFLKQGPLPVEDTKTHTCEKLCVNLNVLEDQCPTSNPPVSPQEAMQSPDDSAIEKNCQVDESVPNEPDLTKSGKTFTSFGNGTIELSFPQTKHCANMRGENNSDVNSDPDCFKNTSQETNFSEKVEHGEEATGNIVFSSKDPSPKSLDIIEHNLPFESEMDATGGELNSSSGVIIPFIGRDTSGLHMVEPIDEVGEVPRAQEVIPFFEETSPIKIPPSEEVSTSQICSKETEQPSPIIPHFGITETNEQTRFGSPLDSRCPTPTIDERQFENMSNSNPSTSSFSYGEDFRDLSQNCPVNCSTLVSDELLHEQKPSPSTGNHRLIQGLDPDLELRTFRVLQTIQKYVDLPNPKNILNQTETTNTQSLAPNCNTRKWFPTCVASSKASFDVNTENEQLRPSQFTPSDLRNRTASNKMTFYLQNNHKPTENINSSFCKTDHILDPKSSHHCGSVDDLETTSRTNCHLSRSFVSTQEEHKSSQSNSRHKYRPYSQRPVMAVKPSKNDESQTFWFPTEVDLETALPCKQTHKVKVEYDSQNPVDFEINDQSEENDSDVNHHQETPQMSSVNSQEPNGSCSKSNRSTPTRWHQRRNKPSPPLEQMLDSSEWSTELVSGKEAFIRHGMYDCTPEKIKPEHEPHRSFTHSKEDSTLSLPQSSLICTIFNTDGSDTASSFLDQMSERCVQNDITMASLEQECLIFTEKMKDLLKKTARNGVKQQKVWDNQKLSCSSPLIVSFSCLEEQRGSRTFLNTSVDGQIVVDVSNKTEPAPKENVSHPEVVGYPFENTGISDLTAECTKVYSTKMDDICSGKKASFIHEGLNVDQFKPKEDMCDSLDFCGQIKKELDKIFRTNLNAVVKKSCKTKHRFHIIVTSEDVFFEEAKVNLEAEGHTFVQPSEFFLGDISSSLFIILRNEDIEEHICRVPHLLKLKMSPEVQFAGIDEPDDVVNLTHQELFTRGGFVVIDRAVLELLSLCNMKKISGVLEELGKIGKWRWMLHYRDSRRLRENARLSSEANEKKLILNRGSDAGILEVLPYHECDMMSQDQPDYLTCLLRLQLQNISSRYAVFITETTDSAFEKNGILSMTLDAFLTKFLTETVVV